MNQQQTTTPTVRQVAAARLVATLALAGAAAGFLIVFAFTWAQPRITAYQIKMLDLAVKEVLGAPEQVKELDIGGDRVFAGYDASGKLVGYAMSAGESGFQDVITVIFGYDAANQRVLGMKVLDNKETPGLGDKIVKDSSFVAEFRNAAPPLLGMKQGAGKGAENEIDMITGATISSRAVINIINHKLEKMAPLLPKEGQQP